VKKFIKKLWEDSVLSKVIANFIVLGILAIWYIIKDNIPSLLNKSIPIINVIIITVLIFTLYLLFKSLYINGYLPFIKVKKPPNTIDLSVDTKSKYYLQKIKDIVRTEAAIHGIHIEGIHIGDRLHINDLKRMCTKVWFPQIADTKIISVLENARSTAFSRKYAEPKEDEKLVDVTKIPIDGLKAWHVYFINILKEQNVVQYNKLDILITGIGNGHAEEPFLSQVTNFKAVDISEEALRYAESKYPQSQMERFCCSAEDLYPIHNNSVDLYISLRTYQSSLFDRRSAIHEAYRVMRNGGLIILSIPTMYINKQGQVIRGLIPSGSTTPNMEYAQNIARRVQGYLTILNFKNVKFDNRSPFEIFILGNR